MRVMMEESVPAKRLRKMILPDMASSEGGLMMSFATFGLNPNPLTESKGMPQSMALMTQKAFD
jgi:hypothetical protein